MISFHSMSVLPLLLAFKVKLITSTDRLDLLTLSDYWFQERKERSDAWKFLKILLLEEIE